MTAPAFSRIITSLGTEGGPTGAEGLRHSPGLLPPAGSSTPQGRPEKAGAVGRRAPGGEGVLLSQLLLQHSQPGAAAPWQGPWPWGAYLKHSAPSVGRCAATCTASVQDSLSQAL